MSSPALRGRGLELARQRPSPYAARLMTSVRAHEPTKLVDTLLCCSLIEARSCERMQRLADALPRDCDLLPLYDDLLACEARHHAAYVELARQLDLVPEPELRRRLAALADHEASVVAAAPALPRLHNKP